MKRRILFSVASLLVSVLSLWLILRDIPLDEVQSSIQQADGGWLIISIALLFLTLWTRAVRWRGLLGFRISLLDSCAIIGITFMANQLPLRAGEVARSLLATRRGVPVMTAATSIIVERLLDTLLVVLMLSWAVAQLPDVPSGIAGTATLFGIAAVFGFAVLLYFAHAPNVARRLLAFVERLLPFLQRLPLADWLEHVIDGLQPLTHWRSFAHTFGWTLIAWGTSLLVLYTLHLALRIDQIDLVVSTVLGIALTSLSIAIPVSIAALGPFEAAIRVTGEAVKMGAVAGISLGFLFHGVAVLTYVLWGIVGLFYMGVSLGDIVQKQSQEQT